MLCHNILIVTDNLYLKNALSGMVSQSPELQAHNWTYRYSPGSSECAGNGEVHSLDVKKEVEYIISNFTLVISLHCKQLFPKRLVEKVRCINVHPGYNPNNRGWYPQVFAILNGLPHGATIHEMDARLDHGGIIAQKRVPIYEWDTSRTVYERVLEAEVTLLREWLLRIVRGDIKAISPNSEGNLNLIKNFRDLCPLDLGMRGTFKEFYDKLRALSHDPYWNAYFIDENGQKIFVRLETKRQSTCES
jgi:dTDP-4-amino-4,6-dideoxyglucose formyltransferase